MRTRLGAVLVMPRAQNPTGAAMSAERGAALRKTLAKQPELLVIEDDHATIVIDPGASAFADANGHLHILTGAHQ